MNADSLVELRDASRQDRKTGKTILDQIAISIDAGDRIGLVGPSGSGKSSLLRAIAYLDPLDRGTLTFSGTQISHNDIPKYRRQVVYVAQRPAFVTATVRRNLELTFEFAVANSKIDFDFVNSLLKKLGKSTDLLDQAIESLSGGEQQIVSMIRAMSMSPQVLLLDEPTAALDADSVSNFEKLTLEWCNADGHHAFVWCSHDERQIGRVTDHQVKMEQGRILQSKST